ncbi:TetR/AcrR family transcriptional regulator [Streptomyces sp. NPDC050738]|uniref:TetR/AcrR family transcriptional regulator n=1 Tax=Streptomyces sp. NPDC050738 TaxID=3154744 RepID=UPI00344955A9
MGHREDLLEGAKRCLLEKGFVRTTARDIVKESKTNLASIGYHYGSKDVLLAQAYVALVEGASETFDGTERAQSGTAPGSLDRFHEVFSNVIATMGGPKSMWRLSMEIVAMGDQMPELRDHLRTAQIEGARGFVPMVLGGEESDVTDEDLETIGRFYMTLMTGIIAQWVFDPEHAPTADQMTKALRRIMEAAKDAG